MYIQRRSTKIIHEVEKTDLYSYQYGLRAYTKETMARKGRDV
jgi:hypothetical protein